MTCKKCHGRGSLPYGVGQQPCPGCSPEVTADTVRDAQIDRLRIDLRSEPVTAEGDETIRCCNVALDSRFGASKRMAARGHCAAAINARRPAKAVRA